MKTKQGILALAFLILFSVVPAHATFILQFDEIGNGRVNLNGGGFVADNGVIWGVDPTSSLLNVLVYSLPEAIVTGDVMIDDVTGAPSDLMRFYQDANQNYWMIYYSADVGGGLAADTGLPTTEAPFGATENPDETFCYLCGQGNNEYQGVSGPTPEPASLTLMGLGLAGVGLIGRRLRKKK